MSLEQLIKKLKPALFGASNAQRPFRLFLSATDMKSRAITRHASAADLPSAFDAALVKLKSALGSIKPTILRADWIVDEQSMTWAEFLTSITRFRRNHYVRGLALDPDFKIAFLEPELNANAMLYRDGKAGDPNCVFNEENCNLYCRARFDCAFPTPQLSKSVITFQTAGAFVSDLEKTPILLDGEGLAADHRPVDHTNPDVLLKLARSAAAYYAADILGTKGRLVDRYPCVDKVGLADEPRVFFDIVGGMLDVYETYGRIGNASLGRAITKAIAGGLKKYILAPVEEKNQAAIRRAALTVLKKHAVVMKTKKYAALIGELENDPPAQNQIAASTRQAREIIDAYFYPEFAMFFKKPNTIVNAFFLRQSAFRVAAADLLSDAVNRRLHIDEPAVEPVKETVITPLDRLSDRLKPTVLDRASKVDQPLRIFLSASDMKSRAITRHASAPDPSVAFDAALDKLKSALGKIKPTILRADWIVEVEPVTWSKLNRRLEKTKRNYFRKGVALDPDFAIAFTECELNANAVFFDHEHDTCFFNPESANNFCRRRYKCDFPTPEPSDIVYLFGTNGAVVADDLDRPLTISDTKLAADHRDLDHTDDALILNCVRTGADHLAGEVLDSGQFVYGRLPCFDRMLISYNTLRHFSSLFAMLDVFGTYDQPTEESERLLRAVERGLEYGIKEFIIHRRAKDGTPVAWIVETRANEIKLGGQGLALLAFTRYTILTKSDKYLSLMNEIADGIIEMQQPDGGFVHVLHSDTFELKDEFRIIYFDGEAVFGLMRLYAITKDDRLLRASERALKHFIADEHWRCHDHWLSYAVNELTLYQPRAEYFEFGINNFLEVLPYIYHRQTQFPTLMELMMAADAQLERMKSMPEVKNLLARVNLEDFYAVLEERARKLLNGYFWEETAMFFARPESILGSFYIRHDAFRVRIDDIQHFLGGLVNYRKYLARRDHTPQPSDAIIHGMLINPEAITRPSAVIAPPAPTALSKPHIPPMPDDFDPSTFPQEFARHNGVIFFMLRNILPKASGLEMSSFRRAKLFKNFFGIEARLITNHYQNDLLKQCAAYDLDFPVLNFYDHYQEIDRRAEPSRVEPKIVNTGKGDLKIRDSYNELGFLGRRQLIELETNRTVEAQFYRRDGSIAMRELYDYPNDKINVKRVELIDRSGAVKHSFDTRNGAIAHWILELVSDRSKKFYLIGDRILDYYDAYIKMTEAGLGNVRVMHQLHNLHVLKPYDPFTSKPGFKYFYDGRIKADIILSLTKHQGDDIVERFKFDNVVVLPHSLTAVPKVEGVELDPFKIIQVGRVVEEKGHAKSVEVMKRVLAKVPQATLHFYGRGAMQEPVQKLIDEAGLNDRIKFEGFVDNMPAVFASAALSILPSTFEGSPLVVQESLQQGCPVVAFNCTYGPDDVIEDGVNGYIVPVDDLDAMAERIVRILTDDKLRESLSRNCAQSLEKFEPKVVARQWAWLFHNLINAW